MFFSSSDKLGPFPGAVPGMSCFYCGKNFGTVGEICSECANTTCENCGEIRAHHSYGTCPPCKSCNHSLDIHDRSTGYCGECGCSAAYSKEAAKHQQRGRGSNKTQAGNPNFGGFASQTSGSYDAGSDVSEHHNIKNSGGKSSGPPAMPGMKTTSSKNPQNSQSAKGKKSGGPPPMPKLKDKPSKSDNQKPSGKNARSKPPEMPEFDTRTRTPSEKLYIPEEVEEMLSPIPEWRNLPWFKNKSDKDGGLNGASPKDTNKIYVNGVLTDIETHRRTLAELSEKLGGVPITGIYNKTEALGLKDAWQTFNDRLQAGGWGRLDDKNKAVEQLITQIKEKNGKIEIYAHSQGAAIVAAALNELYRNSAVDMKNIQVTTLGSFGKEWPQGPEYHHYVHYSDIVPYAGELIGAGQGVIKGVSDWVDGNAPPGTTILWDNKSGMDASVNPVSTHDVSDYISELDEFKKSETLKNRSK